MSLARPTWLPVLCLVLSCATSREPWILPELLARKPVCLALDWSTGHVPIIPAGRLRIPSYFSRTRRPTRVPHGG